MKLSSYLESCLNLFSNIFPSLIPFVALFSFLWMVVMNHFDSAIRGLAIAIPAVISCYYVLKFRKIDLKNKHLNFEENVTVSILNPKQCYSLFFIFYYVSIITLVFNKSRPWYYFLFVSFCYMIVFIQIFLNNRKPIPILIEVFFLMLNLIYSVTLHYDLYFGTTDILSHSFLAQFIYVSGHVISRSVSDYSYFPLFHILLSESSHLLNLDMQTSYFLITGPIYGITAIFIYSLFLRVTKNQQISLLSCALYSSSSNVIYYGTNVITRTMAFIAFVILLYLAFSEPKGKNKATFRFLSIIFAIFLILVHQVSTPQILVIITIIYISSWLSGNKSYITHNYYILLYVMFISYWLFVAYSFFQNKLIIRLKSTYLDSVIILPGNSITETSGWISTVGLFDDAIFLFFALISIGLFLKYRKNNYATFAFTAFFTLIFYVPNPLNSIWQLVQIFLTDRLTLLVSPFMSFVMGVGIYIYLKEIGYVSINISKNKFLIIFILLFIFVFTSSVYSICDSEDLGKNSKHEYFNNQEVKGLNYICETVPYGSDIYSDYPSSTYFHGWIQDFVDLPYYYSHKIESIDKIAGCHGYLLIRQQEFLKRGLYFGDRELKKGGTNKLYEPTKENIMKLNKQLSMKNKLYSNSAVSLYF